jgi:O-antigen ligase
VPWFPAIQAVAIAGLLVAAYFRSLGVVLVGSGALLVATIVVSKVATRMRALDWAVTSVGVYEIASLFVSTYRANSIWYAEIVVIAVLMYLVVRLAIAADWQALIVAGLIGAGGAYLAWTALIDFHSHLSALRDVGLTGIVAFRSRLIAPESYVLGEWLTILLLTLPFACVLALWLWSKGKTRWAAAAGVLAASIVAALCLSCSRAVFWSVMLLCVLAPGLAALCRLLPIWIACVALGAVGLVLAVETTVYPGIVEAYMGGHSSQVRSTEGRIAIWKRSVDLWREHPVWGVGAGNSPLYLNAPLINGGDQDETVGFASRTFSLPFQLLTEKGIIGLLLYGAVFSLATWEMHRRRDLVACCLFAGMVAVLARELTYSSLLEHPVTAMLTTTTLGLICRSAG